MDKHHLLPPGGGKQNYSTSLDNHLASMMQAFVIFGMQCCNVLVFYCTGRAQEACNRLELMAEALLCAEWAGRGPKTESRKLRAQLRKFHCDKTYAQHQAKSSVLLNSSPPPTPK